MKAELFVRRLHAAGSTAIRADRRDRTRHVTMCLCAMRGVDVDDSRDDRLDATRFVVQSADRPIRRRER